MDERFFIVVNAKRGPSQKPMQHRDFYSAQREARRIASLEPGTKVYVFESCGFAVKHDAEWRGFGSFSDPDEIPF